MQSWRVSLEPTKAQEDVPEAPVLQLGGAQCATIKPAEGGEGLPLVSIAAICSGQGRHRSHIRNNRGHERHEQELRQSRSRQWSGGRPRQGM